ncbi:Rve-domain-containing hypothetical protein, partial [Phytophthora megakarya]
MSKVLYVPNLDRKLLSIPALASREMTVVFDDDGCSIQHGGKVVSKVHKTGAMYVWDVHVLQEPQVDEIAALAAGEVTTVVWHARLGHLSVPRMSAVSHAASGTPALMPDESLNGACEGCARGKIAVAPFSHKSGSQIKTQRVLDVVHSDVKGPMTPKSKGGARFTVIFIDDFSRFSFLYFLKAKSEMLKAFEEFRRSAETQTGEILKCIRTDNGGEYTGKRFNLFCAKNGIVHQLTTPYTPQQNGLAERMNRTLVERARSMLYYHQAEALRTAVYLTNRIPNTARSNVTPFEVFWKQQPSLDHIRVFGSRGFMHVDKTLRTKWDSKAHKCMLLGYAEHSKAYRVWDFDASRIATTRTVTLDERPPSSVQTFVMYENFPATTLLDDDLGV